MVLRTNCWKQWTKTTRFSWQYVFKTWQADQTADSLNFKKSITLLLFLLSLFTSLLLCPILPECERRTCKVNCMIWSYSTSLPIFRWQCKETVVDSKFAGERLFPRRRADWVSSTNYICFNWNWTTILLSTAHMIISPTNDDDEDEDDYNNNV